MAAVEESAVALPMGEGSKAAAEVQMVDVPASKENIDPKNCNQLVRAQLSKTKFCELYKQGLCDDGQCSFAHTQDELRRPPDLAKTAICRAYIRKKCFAQDCKYAHGERELRVTRDVYKTQICNFYEKGGCKKGENCRHAHGQGELKEFVAKALNSRDFVGQQGTKISLEGALRTSHAQNLKEQPMKVQLPTVKPASSPLSVLAAAAPPGLPAAAMPAMGAPLQQLVALHSLQMVHHMAATARNGALGGAKTDEPKPAATELIVISESEEDELKRLRSENAALKRSAELKRLRQENQELRAGLQVCSTPTTKQRSRASTPDGGGVGYEPLQGVAPDLPLFGGGNAAKQLFKEDPTISVAVAKIPAQTPTCNDARPGRSQTIYAI